MIPPHLLRASSSSERTPQEPYSLRSVSWNVRVWGPNLTKIKLLQKEFSRPLLPSPQGKLELSHCLEPTQNHTRLLARSGRCLTEEPNKTAT